MGAAGARGQWHRSQPKPLLLFVSWLGAGGGQVSPTRSPVLAAGNGDGGGSPPLQVGLVVVFFFSLYDNNYYIVCFRFFNKAFSPALLAPGWLAAGLCHHGGPTAVLSPLQKITWGCAVEVTRVMYW